MSKPRTIKLTKPLGEITEITVREPTLADFAFVGLVWAVRLANVEPSVLDELAPADARAVHEATVRILLASTPVLTVAADFEREGAVSWQ